MLQGVRRLGSLSSFHIFPWVQERVGFLSDYQPLSWLFPRPCWCLPHPIPFRSSGFHGLVLYGLSSRLSQAGLLLLVWSPFGLPLCMPHNSLGHLAPTVHALRKRNSPHHFLPPPLIQQNDASYPAPLPLPMAVKLPFLPSQLGRMFCSIWWNDAGYSLEQLKS